MTIKKRMFISNILMIIIPAFLAVIILAGCLFIFLASMFPHAEYRLGFQEELTEKIRVHHRMMKTPKKFLPEEVW